MSEQIGKQSLKFENPPYIISSGCVAGTKEGEGPLGEKIDLVGADDKFGCNTWEEAESTLQKEALVIAAGKAGIKVSELRYLFAGDLLGQSIATSFGLQSYDVPLFGLFGACSTAGESISLGAMAVAAEYADLVGAVTSSHFASAEKQFRFPLEYANQRPLCTTWTVTGSGAFILGSQKQMKLLKELNAQKDDNGTFDVQVSGITTGKIVDYGVRDNMNMGAAMAPAAAACITAHLEDFSRSPSWYDKIITGDLGMVGREILLDLLKQKQIDIEELHTDCGIEIYDNPKQGTGSGGSGCGCSAVTLSAHFLPMMRRGELHRILFVPTGALLSKISFNEGQNVPGIAHAIVLETKKEDV
jgi:stage V sporulation protein AD